MVDPEDDERQQLLLDELCTCHPRITAALKSLVADGLVTFQLEMVEDPEAGGFRIQPRFFAAECHPDQ